MHRVWAEPTRAHLDHLEENDAASQVSAIFYSEAKGWV